MWECECKGCRGEVRERGCGGVMVSGLKWKQGCWFLLKGGEFFSVDSEYNS